MKHMKRSDLYQASNYNVTFNPKTVEAFSYKWWKFVAVVDGVTIFNNHYYSPSTAKHQSKVRELMRRLQIQIDIELPLRKGIRGNNLEEIIVEGEETLCDKILEQEVQKEERNLRAKFRRHSKKLTDYLENTVHFRDYEIKQARQFGHFNKVAVHQVVELKTMEHDVENALYNFHRDGFGTVIFYI